jgi:hypothetical protein
MTVGEARLQQFQYEAIPVFVTYHPNYVMRSEEDGKREVFHTVVGDINRFLNFKPEDVASKLDGEVIDLRY